MKVFVTVGNALQPFDSLLRDVEAGIEESGVQISGVCQYGHANARIRQLEGRRFLSRSEFEAEIASADVVIAHAGVGTLFSAMSAGHLPLVAARRLSRGEHVNDHQVEIVAALARTGRVIPVDGPSDLSRALRRFASGDLRRGAPVPTSDAALAPVREALAAVRPAMPGPLRRAALRLLAAVSPPVTRVDR